jgi:hypothetical protein
MKLFKFKTFHGIRALIAHATFRSLPHYFRSLPILLSMASSSASPPFIPPNIGQLMTFKLEGPNYITWSNQVIPILKTNDLMGFVDGSEPCPPKYVLDAEG